MMNSGTSFLVGIGITLATSLLIVFYLRSRLTKILVDLCGTEHRAGFWTALSNVTLVLVLLIFALFSRPEVRDSQVSYSDVSGQLMWAFLGLILTLLVLAYVISQFISRSSDSK